MVFKIYNWYICASWFELKCQELSNFLYYYKKYVSFLQLKCLSVTAATSFWKRLIILQDWIALAVFKLPICGSIDLRV